MLKPIVLRCYACVLDVNKYEIIILILIVFLIGSVSQYGGVIYYLKGLWITKLKKAQDHQRLPHTNPPDACIWKHCHISDQMISKQDNA